MEEKKKVTKKPTTTKKTATKKPAAKKTPVKKTTTSSKTTKSKSGVKKAAPSKSAVKSNAVVTKKKEVKKEEKDLKTTEKIKKAFNIYYFQGIIYSVIAFVMGVYLISNPAVATRVAEIITAIILIIIGFAGAFSGAFKDRVRVSRFNLIFGVLSAIIGVLIMINPFSLSEFLTVSFGIFMILNGALKIDGALSLKKVKEESWSLILTIGLINIIFGIIVIVNPFANLYFTQVVGMFLILYAVMEFTQMVLFKKRSKSVLNLK